MNRRVLVLGLLWDLGLPAAVFYLCRALGWAVLPALVAGGLVALIRVGWVAIARHRLDGVAALVAGSFVVLLIVSLLTGDPRILLARESVLSGAAGLILVGSCLLGRPILYALLRRLNTGNDMMLARLDRRWQTQPDFRRHFLVLSAGLGTVLLAESTLRVVLIILLPVDVVAGWSVALHLGTIAVLVCWALWYRGRRQRAVAGSAS